MTVLGLIPARGGSKGVPFKNKKLLNGKPLISYTLEVALASKLLTKVVVSSDDNDIIKIAKDSGAEAPFVRPEHFASDKATSLSVIQHCLDFYRDKNIHFDAVCLLQPTSPFRTVDFLDKAIHKFQNSEVDSLVSVLKVPDEYNPHWVFVPDSNGNLDLATGENEIITRRQDLPDAYFRDGSIYITKSDVILNQNSLYGSKIGFIESSPKNFVNIDTIEDWNKAEKIAKTI